jgi:hypothetical protein
MMLRYFLKSSAVILLSILLSGVAWGAVDFNGDADYVYTGTFTNRPNSNQSYSGWIKTSTAGEQGISCFSETNPPNEVVDREIRETAANKISFYITTTNGGIGYTVTSNTSINDGIWHHFVFVYGNLGLGQGIYCYIDGIYETSASGSSGFTGYTSAQYNLASARNLTNLATIYFDGEISEMAIWQSALTAGEISQLANSRIKGMPLQIQPTNLVLYLPLDENPLTTGINGVQFDDYSGNGNNGTGVDADGDSLIIGESVLSYPPKVIGD